MDEDDNLDEQIDYDDDDQDEIDVLGNDDGDDVLGDLLQDDEYEGQAGGAEVDRADDNDDGEEENIVEEEGSEDQYGFEKIEDDDDASSVAAVGGGSRGHQQQQSDSRKRSRQSDSQQETRRQRPRHNRNNNNNKNNTNTGRNRASSAPRGPPSSQNFARGFPLSGPHGRGPPPLAFQQQHPHAWQQNGQHMQQQNGFGPPAHLLQLALNTFGGPTLGPPGMMMRPPARGPHAGPPVGQTITGRGPVARGPNPRGHSPPLAHAGPAPHQQQQQYPSWVGPQQQQWGNAAATEYSKYGKYTEYAEYAPAEYGQQQQYPRPLGPSPRGRPPRPANVFVRNIDTTGAVAAAPVFSSSARPPPRGSVSRSPVARGPRPTTHAPRPQGWNQFIRTAETGDDTSAADVSSSVDNSVGDGSESMIAGATSEVTGLTMKESCVKLALSGIPADQCTMMILATRFGEFGEVVNIALEPEHQRAEIQFKTAQEAMAAFKDTLPVFENSAVEKKLVTPPRPKHDLEYSSHTSRGGSMRGRGRGRGNSTWTPRGGRGGRGGGSSATWQRGAGVAVSAESGISDVVASGSHNQSWSRAGASTSNTSSKAAKMDAKSAQAIVRATMQEKIAKTQLAIAQARITKVQKSIKKEQITLSELSKASSEGEDKASAIADAMSRVTALMLEMKKAQSTIKEAKEIYAEAKKNTVAVKQEAEFKVAETTAVAEAQGSDNVDATETESGYGDGDGSY